MQVTCASRRKSLLCDSFLLRKVEVKLFMFLTSSQIKDYYKTGDEPSDEDDPEEFRELRGKFVPRRTLSTRKSYFFVNDHVRRTREGNFLTGVFLSTWSLGCPGHWSRRGGEESVSGGLVQTGWSIVWAVRWSMVLGVTSGGPWSVR